MTLSMSSQKTDVLLLRACNDDYGGCLSGVVQATETVDNEEDFSGPGEPVIKTIADSATVSNVPGSIQIVRQTSTDMYDVVYDMYPVWYTQI